MFTVWRQDIDSVCGSDVISSGGETGREGKGEQVLVLGTKIS